MPMSQIEVDRFMRFVEPEPLSGCWLWSGAVSKAGYAVFTRGNGEGGSHGWCAGHRWSLEFLKGTPVPKGMHTDHKCRVRCCVNPAHLEVVTPAENVRRCPDHRGTCGANAKKTHCPQGHPLPDRRNRRGQRRCPICHCERECARYWRTR